MKPRGVILIDGAGAYGALSGLNGWIATALEQLGYAPLRWNLLARDVGARFDHFRDNYQVVAGIGAGGFGARLTVSNVKPFWGEVRIPFVSWLVDHPAYLVDNHRSADPFVAQLYTCTELLDFQRRYVRSPGRVGLADLGMPDLGPTTEKSGEPLILFPKTGNDPAELERAWAALPSVLVRIIYGAAEEVLARPTEVSVALCKVARFEGVELENDFQLLCFLSVQVDDYVRRLKSTGLARAILDLPVTVCGAAWDHIDTHGARARFLGARPYAEVLALSAQATAVLTMNPNLDTTVHERVWSALAVGTLPISDRNSFLRENFPMLDPYLFDWSGDGEVQAIRRVLDDPGSARDAALAAHHHAAEEFPLRAQVARALELAEVVGYLQADRPAPQSFFVPAAA